jgi:hypothetical protein
MWAAATYIGTAAVRGVDNIRGLRQISEGRVFNARKKPHP